MKRFIVREANLFEFEDVRAFYKANPDEHVMLRAEEVVKAAISEESSSQRLIPRRRIRPGYSLQAPFIAFP